MRLILHRHGEKSTSPQEASMFVNAMPGYELLSEDAMAVLDRAGGG